MTGADRELFPARSGHERIETQDPIPCSPRAERAASRGRLAGRSPAHNQRKLDFLRPRLHVGVDLKWICTGKTSSAENCPPGAKRRFRLLTQLRATTPGRDFIRAGLGELS